MTDDWPENRKLGPWRRTWDGGAWQTTFDFEGVGRRTVVIAYGCDAAEVIANLTAIEQARESLNKVLTEYYDSRRDYFAQMGYNSSDHWIAYLSMFDVVSYHGEGKATISFGRGYKHPIVSYDKGTFSFESQTPSSLF